MTDLRDRITRAADSAGATAAAVALYDYQKALPFSHDGGRWFHAASTIKAPLLLAVYHMAEQGRIRLDDTLHVRNRFRSMAGGVFRVAAGRDGDSEVHRRRGRSMGVRDLARAMIVRSSNLATNLLLDFIGVEEVRHILATARLDGIELRRGVEDSAAFDQGINNEVTADGLVRCFRLLCQEGFFRAETREQMIEVLCAQEFNAMLPAPLPREARVAHKTGEISTVCHDAGIVFLPDRKPYAVAILTQWPVDIEHRHACVAEISRAVYEHVTGGEGGAP
ncbi:MAG TPA: serine hydrolase [Chthoniobacteraceae bacterium]|jgi:beta-lactamase class A|nr:serine hydrolase [Chthoniobacteraceae bacterium]